MPRSPIKKKRQNYNNGPPTKAEWGTRFWVRHDESGNLWGTWYGGNVCLIRAKGEPK